MNTNGPFAAAVAHVPEKLRSPSVHDSVLDHLRLMRSDVVHITIWERTSDSFDQRQRQPMLVRIGDVMPDGRRAIGVVMPRRRDEAELLERVCKAVRLLNHHYPADRFVIRPPYDRELRGKL